jgi:ribosomal protein S18 acetylase RimI-like enzyme
MEVSAVEVLPGDDSHLEGILRLFWAALGRRPLYSYVEQQMLDCPAAVALSDEEVVGFVYSEEFTPDVLHLTNIVVHARYRGQGLGTRLLACLEEQAASHYKAVILSNSTLYDKPSDIRLPTEFYLRNGYSVRMETPSTRVFGKIL